MALQGSSRFPAAIIVHYSAGFIVLSYVISLVGCVTTLELLHRRTSRRGAYNWYLLVSSCITMGGVGIWCMHFVGNRAIVVQPHQTAQQIVYSPAFTALSFFLPIVVLFVAFYILGITDRVNRYYITVSGILAGTAICGMHYVGQLGIANYSCTYRVQNVVGAAAIAVAASLISLSVFFRLRETWTNSWWKRASCGALLACAVSGMHWTATVGTNYKFKGGVGNTGYHSRIGTIIVATVLSVVTCVILLCFTLVTTRKIHIYKTRAQQLVLACGYFDEQGRVMVTSEGALPCAKITNHYVEKTFGEDELSRTHPTFVWVFKASRNWLAIKSLIPGMQANLNTDPVARKHRPEGSNPVDDESETVLDFSAVFKQLFCVAAQNLANTIHEPLEKLGVLFEEPLETGTTNKAFYSQKGLANMRRLSCNSSPPESKSESSVPYFVGRGQYLFVTRQLSAGEVNKLAAQGYRFAAISSIADTMAKTMRVPQGWILGRLERMRISASSENLLAPGVYLAAFLLRPSVHKSFDVLVPANTQNQLPGVALPLQTLTDWQVKELRKFDNWTIAAILKVLINASTSVELDQDFRWQLYRAFSQLIERVGDPSFMMQANFSAKLFEAPCQRQLGTNGPTTCTLLSVRSMQSVHTQAPCPGLTYVPLSFFSAQQQMDSGLANHGRFARLAREEFGSCVNKEFKTKSQRLGRIGPMTPTSLFRTSRQWSRSGDAENNGSKDLIVGSEVEKEWVEMTKRRQLDRDKESALNTVTVDSSDDGQSRDSSEVGAPWAEAAQVPAIASGEEKGSPMPPGLPTNRRAPAEVDHVVKIGLGEAKADGEAETATFASDMFKLFKL